VAPKKGASTFNSSTNVAIAGIDSPRMGILLKSFATGFVQDSWVDQCVS
jgi:hypothetical protein